VSFTNDLTEMFGGPFGVSATSGGTTANGILDEPTSIVAGDQVLYVDRVLHCKSSDFGTLVGGDSITVGGVSYKVRTCEKDIDGLTCQISLEKV